MYNWFKTLEPYIKPEEDAKIEEKLKKRYDRLEQARNMEFNDDYDFTSK